MQDIAIKSVHKALAEKLASHKIGDATIAKVTDRIVQEGLKIGRVDFFPYGIKVDYFADSRVTINKLLELKRYRTLKVFPYGLLEIDHFHVQVELEVPELAGQIGR